MPIIVNLSGTTFSDTSLPKLQRDPFVVNGTQFLFDFKNTYCWPAQNAAIAGSIFNNLVDGGTTATMSGNADAFTGGGLVSTGGARYVTMGTGYDLSATNPSFAMGCWFSLPASSPATSDYISLYGKSINTTGDNIVGRMDLGLGGDALRAQAHNNGLQIRTPDLSLGMVYQAVLSWTPVGSVATQKLIVNNVLLGSNTSADVTLPSLPSQPWIFGGHGMGGSNNFRGRMFRCWMENLTVSGRTPEQAAAADWAVGNGRFTA